MDVLWSEIDVVEPKLPIFVELLCPTIRRCGRDRGSEGRRLPSALDFLPQLILLLIQARICQGTENQPT